MNLTLPAGGKSFTLIQAAGLGPGDRRALRELPSRGEGLKSPARDPGLARQSLSLELKGSRREV